MLADVHAVLNRQPDPDLVAAIRHKLASLGIPAIETDDQPRTCGVLRLLGTFDFVHCPRLGEDIDEQLNEPEREFADAA